MYVHVHIDDLAVMMLSPASVCHRLTAGTAWSSARFWCSPLVVQGANVSRVRHGQRMKLGITALEANNTVVSGNRKQVGMLTEQDGFVFWKLIALRGCFSYRIVNMRWKDLPANRCERIYKNVQYAGPGFGKLYLGVCWVVVVWREDRLSLLIDKQHLQASFPYPG